MYGVGNRIGILRRGGSRAFFCFLVAAALLVLQGCAQADLPGARQVSIPNPTFASEREAAVNERPDSVLYLPLGRDVLVPEVGSDDPLPSEIVGPFELRSETLAGALQLILADYDVSLAFESEQGLSRQITVANLKGPLNKVVRRICGLADMYCAYEDGLLIVKETQTFTVKIPPISQDESFMNNVATGLQAIIGSSPIVDQSTRTLVYEATQRTASLAERYFQRMRSSTALIVFETYIWEVSLNSGNSTGIRWQTLDTFGKFAANIDINGSVGADFSNPISIGLPTTQGAEGGAFSPTDIFDFLSQFGAVKTISQPQITVLSGSEARLRAADKENYVAEVSQTIDNGQSTTSVSTSSVDTGFTVTIGSAWDNATIYANIEISLSDVSEIEDFNFESSDGGSTTVQLPKTTERELETQVRIRPGDSLLIAGLVRESDAFSSSGPGFAKPVIPASRTATADNLELVFLLRPRVIVYTSPSEGEYYGAARGGAVTHEDTRGVAENVSTPVIDDDKLVFEYDFSPLKIVPDAVAPNDGGEQQ
ncbi:MAG: type II and III secretion system family protein [Rhodospirillales bacterium]|nr:type II and III secretion system family protein [Rhodospirillales bacterium]